jgi:uncharacterized protein (TIGR00251 family)
MGEAAATSARLGVRVIPGARRDAVAGAYGEGVKVRVAAPAEDGRANRSLCAVLAGALGVPVAQVRIVHGETRRDKVVEIDGVDAASARAALVAAAAGPAR